MRPLLVFALACFAGALSMGLIQTRGTVTFAAISPKWSRFSPASNIGQVFGMHSLVRLAKSLIPTTVVALLAVGKLSSESIYPSSSFHALRVLFNHVYDLLLDTAIATALWSAVDFLNNWRSREDRLKMSKQDVKDETKQSEGSPQIKRRIRQLQRQSRKRKLRADVRKATVVLTNPTHYAVALSFDFTTMEAPRVLAKGMNLIAKQIREEAQWAGVPIVENPALARSLYRSVEPGQSIPLELYAAIAAILAYLYRKEVKDRMAEEQKAARSAPFSHAR
jgi:flagellar biosynthetic protein FlhB